ncbi:hypothetical protein N8351_05250 [Flavobacteriaceae bacterium]|nr:hypothetical protein [Flavobacteriaceae bacterium]
MNKIFNVELIEFEKIFKKKLKNFFNNKEIKTLTGNGFNTRDETLKRINSSSWFSTELLSTLKGEIDENKLLFSVDGFLVFFESHFLVYHSNSKKSVWLEKEYYETIGKSNYIKIDYVNLFNYSKYFLFPHWGNDNDMSLGPYSLKTFNETKKLYLHTNQPTRMGKWGSVKKKDQEFFPFKYLQSKNHKDEREIGLWFDKFSTSSDNLIRDDYTNHLNPSSLDLENISGYSYIFKWFEKSINEIEIELCQNILNKLDKEGQIKTKELNLKKKSVFSEIDKDGNGLVDVIEGFDEIDLLLKKHQGKIISIDSKHVMEFVQVSNYLKLKKKNIQKIFEELKKVSDEQNLKIYLQIFKDNIHVYDLITLNSLLMINSLINTDMITFSNIYLKFDGLNIFDLKHEKDISNKLNNLEKGLDNLMGVIRKVGDEICDEIYSLSSITEESNKQLSNQLSEIDSTMKVGNLISTINTYQNYKTNRRLNS